MLRLGDWRDVLADVECDALIVDPPYGERVHSGSADIGKHAKNRRALSYANWSPADVLRFVLHWSPRVSGWFCAMTCHDLSFDWKKAFESVGRYAFAPVPIVAPRVRLLGDGPASAAVYLMVARPRSKRFMSWGALPGWYKAGIDRGGRIGGKPLSLMRALVRDYSRPGDLVCDPCAGHATTLLAAMIEGRRAIGAEIDPASHKAGTERLGAGYTPDMLAGLSGKQAELKL